MVSSEQFAVGDEAGWAVGEDADLIVLIVRHIGIECRRVLFFVGNDLSNQLYCRIVFIPVPVPAPDDDLLQGGVGYGEKDGQWPNRGIGYMDGGGGVSAGAEPDLAHPVTDGDTEFSLRIRQAALAGGGKADADIRQGETGKGIENNAREEPGLCRCGAEPQEG